MRCHPERQQTTSDGAIRVRRCQPPVRRRATALRSGEWFEPEHWRARGARDDASGGRGGVDLLDAPFGDWALRHYRRGGMVAHAHGRSLPVDRRRAHARLRRISHARRPERPGMRVPRPVAARYRRNGVHYRADLITHYIRRCADAGGSFANGCGIDRATRRTQCGAGVAEFHAAGAYHADLNAHNVLRRHAQRLAASTSTAASCARRQRTLAAGESRASAPVSRQARRRARDGEPAFERESGSR